MKELRRNQRVYLMHVVHLIGPGLPVPVLEVDRVTPASLDGWEPAELTLMIEEGRRQSDRQQAQLEEIRGRAQWVFTAGAAVLAALGTAFISADPPVGYAIAWVIGMLLLVFGVGGAAAILTVRADFRSIHTGVLSNAKQPIDHSLATSYTKMMATGENTVATRLTVFRQAVVYCLSGGYIGLIAVLLTN